MKLKTKFQDEDFELGEVVEGVTVECLGKHEEKLRVIATAAKGGQHTFYYSSIKKFMDDWEDAPEEPKEYWSIDCFVPDGDLVSQFSNCSESVIENRKSIGNYFDTREEAEKAAERLRAWKRLKDKGFKFTNFNKLDGLVYGRGVAEYNIKAAIDDGAYEVEADIELLFGGEE